MTQIQLCLSDLRPTALEAERIVQQARLMFARTLATWASDVLLLREAGRQCPCWPGASPRDDLNLAA